jgi:hypothetical protein
MIPPLAAISDECFRYLFKDGERLLVLSSCVACGEALIATDYDGFLQDWEREHTCAFRIKAA